MKHSGKEIPTPTKGIIPFPTEWIKSDPEKVQQILNKLSLEDQARCAMLLTGQAKQDLLLISRVGNEVIKLLPPEEIYFMVKEIGPDDSLPFLSAVSVDQLQYIFDLEWWQRDRFMPDRALEWLIRLDKNNDKGIFDWLTSEDFDQIIMVLQSLIKVFKDDEMTNSYSGIEDLKHFTLDGKYDIFFKVPRAEKFLKRFLKILYDRSPNYFQNIMEGIIWNPITSTVEKAYQWRLSRVSARGIPEFKEAIEIYSILDADALVKSVPEPEDFFEEEPFVAPHHVMAQIGTSSFFGLCLPLLENTRRVESIRWELVYLANKVLVADCSDPSNMDLRKQAMAKVLSCVSIGLELGSQGDPKAGGRLLQNTWMQPLFQVGYGRLIKLKWMAEKLFNEKNNFLSLLLAEGETERLVALIKERLPKWKPNLKDTEKSCDIESLNDLQKAEIFLNQCEFFPRFTRQALDISRTSLEKLLQSCQVPTSPEELSIIWLTSTALARFVLFDEVTCQPLSESAAKSFLEMIFIASFNRDEPRLCDDDLIENFKNRLLDTPMAWTDLDRRHLDQLLRLCEENLREHFGRIDLKQPVMWHFTRGLCISII